MILASNNKNKLREIKQILSDFQIKSLEEVGIDIDVVEDQDSFYGNALKKAKEIYEVTHEPVIADDSGLCIDIYNGWPGVYTARFLGENTSAEERNLHILDKMKDVPFNDRTAKVICTLIYYDGISIIEGTGIINGHIAFTIRGNRGFGFDDIFELTSGKTLGELTSEEKNIISARYLATLDLNCKLKELDIDKHSIR